MIDFLNNALSTMPIECHRLAPIYADIGVIYTHYVDFSEKIMKSLQEYYLYKGKFNIFIESNYSAILHFRDNYKFPEICKLDYNKFIFYLEFVNIESRRAILLGIDRESPNINISFYENYNSDDYSKVSKKGELGLLSNMDNHGISMHLLNIFYEFMENGYFDQENPFYDLRVI